MRIRNPVFICVVLVVFDVTMVMRIQERKAQIARTAYFTVPIVSATVGWMGALEIAKKVMAPSPFFLLSVSYWTSFLRREEKKIILRPLRI
jgi:hypothetical protein